MILSKVERELSSGVRAIKTLFNINTEYPYSTFSISLPAYHLLPTNQKQCKLYDRFLPHLVRYLPPNSVIIDVGANCGDTLAAMYDANKNLNYVCIEPDKTFFTYLQTNSSRIKTFDKCANILTIRSLVGKNITNVSLEGSKGTKVAITCDENTGLHSQPLDQILSLCKITDVRLLKSDADGCDYDIIDSAEETILSDTPLIFFECWFPLASQKEGFEKTIVNLESKGYRDWIIFDNFGNIVLQTTDIHQVFQLLDYVWRQNLDHSPRTIGYYDILTFTKKDTVLVKEVMTDYKKLHKCN